MNTPQKRLAGEPIHLAQPNLGDSLLPSDWPLSTNLKSSPIAA
jgi:hypothetical protein